MSSKPDTVKVGALLYDISWDPNLTFLGAAGMTNPDNLILGIDPTTAPGVQRVTLVHEMLHAVWKQTHLSSKYPDEDKDSEGEQIIRTLEPFIFQFILDNPEVVRWLRS